MLSRLLRRRIPTEDFTRMSDHYADRPAAEPVDTPVALSHFVHTVSAYKPAIVMSILAVIVGYIIIATVLYLVAPSQRITVQPFRLDFQGATISEYPNGTPFNTSDIVGTQILLKVFEQNELSRYTRFQDFGRSVFVLEANPAFERMAADYTARLADPKLSPIDRERILREWDAKKVTIARNDYSINYVRRGDGTIPETLVRKVLLDILNEWARWITNEQHVLEYRMAILSPEIMTLSDADAVDPVETLLIVRAKITRVMRNIDDLLKIPGADLVRTAADRMSLDEVSIRLDEIVRFRIDPLITIARTNGLVSNPAATIRFVETQLAYDQRQLELAQRRADSIRDALAVYSSNPRGLTAETPSATSAGLERTKPGPAAGGTSESVVPQVSDTFLDKLMLLTSQATDVQYRQKIVDEYRKAAQEVVPARDAVAFDQEIVQALKTPVAAGPANGATVRQQIAATQADARQLVIKVNEIYKTLSRNLNPAGQIYATTQPPIVRVERVRSFTRLMLYGALIVLLSIPVIIILSLLHNRLREEERVEGYHAPEAAMAP